MDLYRSQVTHLHRQCTKALYEGLIDCGLVVAPPQGAFYVYPSFYPYAKQLEVLGIRTSLELSRWLIEECGIAALPGSAFGEDDSGPQGGRFRLRMATSYLYFQDKSARYTDGYALLEVASSVSVLDRLPMLHSAIEAMKAAVEKIRRVHTPEKRADIG